MATSRTGRGLARLKAGVSLYEFFVNFVCPMILLVAGYLHLFHGWLPGMPLDLMSVGLIDGYIVLLMLLAALKLPTRLPQRQIALVTIPALFLVLVMSFAGLYIANKHVKRATVENKLEPLDKPWDAAYFSLVTITTLGYGDYVPQEQDARKLVIGELLSGALLLFFAFPVLGSRLANFDASTGTTIRRLPDESWEVQHNNECPIRYAKGKRLTLSVSTQGVIEAKTSD
jgi:Ion channel